MQTTRILIILCLIGTLLTCVLSDMNMANNDEDDFDLIDGNHAISKRFLAHTSHHHDPMHHDPTHQKQCVRCKFSLARCCLPNICVKRRLRTDKCLRIKG
ncbi:unnamed protein product [Adineta steineri]|uniref:Uncharacterized protein n=1 Tax=Adineta steineri TaxID=433720 RepID=A0A819IG86_9BILA|nr:unnamed protein product [Adineta steineri]CAF0882431.1 unnamed protein product [Adineta steineri]CAF3667480.1 unnamed protein product [Adineta steineri]CAF3917827.1 unnamed protein product [Adineta steineri]